ncbi:MAG: hypothetical protein EBR82_87260, partial [Caulobacteraceae bacterium]|nr:hypothetical protein [Caulobacteraceae bacterium]
GNKSPLVSPRHGGERRWDPIGSNLKTIKERKRIMKLKAKAEQRIKDELTPINLEELYREVLDESGAVEIGGLSFMPSDIIEKLDPVAFRCGVNDYADSLINDTITDEIDGEYYDLRDAQDIVDEVEAELEELENA